MSFVITEEFDLFTIPEIEEEPFGVNKNGSKTAFVPKLKETDTTSLLKFDFEVRERVTVHHSTFVEVKRDMRTTRNKSLAKFLKTLNIGDTIYLDGFNKTYRADIKEVLDGAYKASYYVYDAVKREYNPYEQMSNFEGKEWTERDVLATRREGDICFFTLNPDKNVKLVSQNVCLEYAEKSYGEIGLPTMAVYYNYFSMQHLSDDKLVSKDITGAFKKSGDVACMPIIYCDYWEKPFNLKFNSKNKNNYFKFNYFGHSVVITRAEMDKTFNAVIEKLSQVVPTALDNLNDFELMIFYTLQGYIVNHNMTTNEWAIRKNGSEKAFFVERIALNNFIEMTMFVNNDLIKQNAITKVLKRNDALAKKFVDNVVELKPFVIPAGTIVELPKNIVLEEDKGVYEVVKDDGRYVTLKNIESLKQKDILIPRKDITKVNVKVAEYGIAPIGNYVDVWMSIPYAIPVEQESTIEQLCINYQTFIQSLPEDEYYKYLVFDATVNNGSINQALMEQDFDEVAPYFINNRNNRIMSRYVAKRTNAVIDFMLYNAEHYNAANLFGRKPHQFMRYHKQEAYKEMEFGPAVIDAIDKNVAFEVYCAMYEAVRTLPASELTIVELMLAYRLNNMKLDYHGPTHFEINGECVHSSKYDLFNIAKTKQQVFFK